jgi:hypothetical protein
VPCRDDTHIDLYFKKKYKRKIVEDLYIILRSRRLFTRGDDSVIGLSGFAQLPPLPILDGQYIPSPFIIYLSILVESAIRQYIKPG